MAKLKPTTDTGDQTEDRSGIALLAARPDLHGVPAAGVTLVNTETAELIEPMDADAARRGALHHAADRLRDGRGVGRPA